MACMITHMCCFFAVSPQVRLRVRITAEMEGTGTDVLRHRGQRFVAWPVDRYD